MRRSVDIAIIQWCFISRVKINCYQTPQAMTMKAALEGMLAGDDGIYMKFNREFPKDEEVFGTAIDRATDVLRAQGGPIVVDALAQTVKVGRILCSLLSLVRLEGSWTGYIPDLRRLNEHTPPQRYASQLVLPNRRYEEMETL